MMSLPGKLRLCIAGNTMPPNLYVGCLTEEIYM